MLHGLYTGYLTLPHGMAGRTLLGRKTTRVVGSVPVGADSLVPRLTPTPSANDVLITSMQAAPGNYDLRVDQNGVYEYNAFKDGSRQTVTVDAYYVGTRTLAGEGTLTINDLPPQPAGGQGTTFFPNTVFTLNQTVDIQLVAVDPDGDLVTFAIHSGALPPGLTMTSAGHVTGSTSAFGTFGFVTRISDPFGSFTDIVDTISVANALPNFVGQLLSVASPQVAALGLSISTNTLPSAQLINTILAQFPIAGTNLVVGSTITFTLSDGSLSVGNPSVFPQNIKGLTWEGARSYVWRTTVQKAVTGKTSTLSYSQYPIVEWELNYELLDRAAAIDDLRKIVGLFNQMQGQTNTFLYEDSAFNSVTAYPFGTGDGITRTFQLIAGNNNVDGPFGFEIVQAVQPTPAIQIYDNGVLVSSANYSVGPTGIVTFPSPGSPPASGHTLTWTGKFYYNCRFDEDISAPEQFMSTFWSLQALKFHSVIL